MSDKCPKCGADGRYWSDWSGNVIGYCCGSQKNNGQWRHTQDCRIRELEQANRRLRDELARLADVACQQDHESITRLLEETKP